jgi:hypothetical protein
MPDISSDRGSKKCIQYFGIDISWTMAIWIRPTAKMNKKKKDYLKLWESAICRGLKEYLWGLDVESYLGLINEMIAYPLLIS